jgi:hypothetical protein
MDNRSYADIYVGELEHLVRGYPVYCPDRNIHIGDVGFFRRNDNDHPFERLFNVLCDASDPGNQEYGVPEGFITYQEFLAQRRKPGEKAGRIFDIIPDYYQPKEFMSASGITRELKVKGSTCVVSLYESDSIFNHHRPEDLPASVHAEVTFTLSRETSAILSLSSTATRAEIIDKGSWRDYIASWYTFARAHDFEEDQAPIHSIVLIKGCDKAEHWEHATFRGGKKGASITFGASASKGFVAELSGSWTSTLNLSPFQRKTPPDPRASAPHFDVDPKRHNQTVFVRFYKIECRRTFADRIRGIRSVRVTNNDNATIHLRRGQIYPRIHEHSISNTVSSKPDSFKDELCNSLVEIPEDHPCTPTTPSQLRILEETFMVNEKPAQAVHQKLAEELNMTPRAIQVLNVIILRHNQTLTIVLWHTFRSGSKSVCLLSTSNP